MIDIGKDLQDAFDDGYRRAMQDGWISVSERLPEEDKIAQIINEGIPLAISALEKQIPKRAKETQELMDIEYICPICGRANHSRFKYCWGCGQAIDH